MGKEGAKRKTEENLILKGLALDLKDKLLFSLIPSFSFFFDSIYYSILVF